MQVLGYAIPDMVVYVVIYLLFKTILNTFFNKPHVPIEVGEVVSS